MSSTAFKSVTPFTPRMIGIGYVAFPLNAAVEAESNPSTPPEEEEPPPGGE